MNTRTLKEFLSLPVNSDETWQGGIVPVADVLGVPPAKDADDMAMVLWRSASSELVHAKPISLASESRLNAFVEVMLELSTEHEFPFRPARIECHDQELVDGFSNLLRDSETTAIMAEIPEWNAVLEDMTEHFGVAAPRSLRCGMAVVRTSRLKSLPTLRQPSTGPGCGTNSTTST